MNIVSKDILHPCTSCGGCAAVCPANAIVMVLNEQGFYRPVLDVDKCVDCSLCTKVCYKYDDVKPYNIAEHKEILPFYAVFLSAVRWNFTAIWQTAF